jgi:hypothetical protein
VVRLGRRTGQNGSLHGVGAGRGDEMKNKIKKYRLTAGNLTKRGKGIYKKVSNVYNLIFNRIQTNCIWNLIIDHTSIQE